MYVYPMKTKKNVSTKGGGKKDGKIVPFIPIQTNQQTQHHPQIVPNILIQTQNVFFIFKSNISKSKGVKKTQKIKNKGEI